MSLNRQELAHKIVKKAESAGKSMSADEALLIANHNFFGFLFQENIPTTLGDQYIDGIIDEYWETRMEGSEDAAIMNRL